MSGWIISERLKRLFELVYDVLFVECISLFIPSFVISRAHKQYGISENLKFESLSTSNWKSFEKWNDSTAKYVSVVDRQSGLVAHILSKTTPFVVAKLVNKVIWKSHCIRRNMENFYSPL